MFLPPVLAHGALGVFDEIIFASVAVIFIVMMALSWFKSRNSLPEMDDEAVTPATPQDSAPESPDRFRLQ
jgi:hypothetical protein